MSLIFYDLTFLVAFAIFVSIFLYSRKHNLKREGLLFLYKTTWGIKLINYLGEKNEKVFRVLSYISITIGYILMASMIYLLGRIVYIYIAFPSIVRELKVPPITPLIPYLPQIFKIDFLPSFYFIDWIVIIAIIAITHEVAHGIFARHNKVGIKSTGFGFFPFFLPIFLAAFVELDEKEMAKKSIFAQLAVLSAGTFANVLTGILFFGVLLIYFSFAFTPAGVIYDTYPHSVIDVSTISMMNGVDLENPTYDQILNLANDEKFNKITVGGVSYLATTKILEEQTENLGQIGLYHDAPAINAELESVITKINGETITNIKELETTLSKYSPNEEITLTVLDDEGDEFNKKITLGEFPGEESRVWLGIGFATQQSRSGLLGKIYTSLASFKDRNTYYEKNFGEGSLFFYDLLWWLILISLSVALVNMLPVGIFDGGRFFYLTILAITGSKRKAEKAFSASTYLLLFLIFVLMFFWAKSFF